MQFLVHSSKTKQFLYESIYRPTLRAGDRAMWTPNMHSAKLFKTPSEAYQVASRQSATSKAHVVLWDGVSMWNLTESKA